MSLFVCQKSATLVTHTSAALTCVACSQQEIDDLCEEWQPEPLHKPLPNSQALPEPPVISRCCCIVEYCVCPLGPSPRMCLMWRGQCYDMAFIKLQYSAFVLRRDEVTAYCKPWHAHAHVPCSAAGAWVVANGRRALNMVSPNFLGVAGDPVIMVRSQKVARH